MMVYMIHPKHGRMPVYRQWQIEENLKNGWRIEPEEEPKRRGRPPKADVEPADDASEA